MATDYTAAVNAIINTTWDIRDGQVVPDSASVKLTGGAVKFEATMLYADLADSTQLVQQYDSRVAAKVYKAFLANACKIIRSHNGYIRSFDGDRVMAVFLGQNMRTRAVRTAMEIHWFVSDILKPTFQARYEVLRAFPFGHGTGADTSSVLAVRGGIANNNDLVWIGNAANVAAKLSALRQGSYRTFVTGNVFTKMHESVRYSKAAHEDMWEKIQVPGIGDVYRSFWRWEL